MLRRICNFMMRMFLQRRSIAIKPYIPSEQCPIEVSREEPFVYVAHIAENESISTEQRKSPQTILEFAMNNRIAAMKRAIINQEENGDMLPSRRRLISDTIDCSDPC
jgi:hypothetical protein